jgi:iron complex transport system substrate-binding protein
MAVSALLSAVSAASLNLCTDEYLLLLAKPQEIASVSFLSQDPQESSLWKTARAYRANRGSLEDVIATKPSLVLTMGGGGRATSLIARRLGIRAIDLRPAASLDDVATNLRKVAAALGEPGRADPWLQRASALRTTAPKSAMDSIWISGGGQSLPVPSVGADWLALAGLRQRPLPGGRVTLETMLVRPPSILVESRYRSGQMSLGSAWLNHPIVRNAKSRRIVTDGRAWTCMGPLLIGEIERLKVQVQ